MLEGVAAERPLVVVVEDVQWAEPTLLDLLEYLVVFSTGHPILLVCLTRPELAESRPAWTAPQPDRSVLVLDALSTTRRTSSSSTPVAERRGGHRGDRRGQPAVPRAARRGRQRHGHAADDDPGGAGRAHHRLEPAERAVLAHASVQGRRSTPPRGGALPEDDRGGTATRLVALVHKQLIRVDRSGPPGRDAFAFAHALIREAAYRSLPKQQRAELHERLARWMESRPSAADETVGYHLAEAHRYRTELGESGGHVQALAWAAAERLAAAADTTLLRGDHAAGARLLERVATLLEGDDAARGELLPVLGAALFEAGRMADATRVLDGAIAAAPEPRLLARARSSASWSASRAASGWPRPHA